MQIYARCVTEKGRQSTTWKDWRLLVKNAQWSSPNIWQQEPHRRNWSMKNVTYEMLVLWEFMAHQKKNSCRKKRVLRKKRSAIKRSFSGKLCNSADCTRCMWMRMGLFLEFFEKIFKVTDGSSKNLNVLGADTLFLLISSQKQKHIRHHVGHREDEKLQTRKTKRWNEAISRVHLSSHQRCFLLVIRVDISSSCCLSLSTTTDNIYETWRCVFFSLSFSDHQQSTLERDTWDLPSLHHPWERLKIYDASLARSDQKRVSIINKMCDVNFLVGRCQKHYQEETSRTSAKWWRTFE